MMGRMTEAFVAIATALAGVALVAVLVSKNSQTSGVINALFSGYATALKAAMGGGGGGGAGGAGGIMSNGS
jgi:hypothetical protein